MSLDSYHRVVLIETLEGAMSDSERRESSQMEDHVSWFGFDCSFSQSTRVLLNINVVAASQRSSFLGRRPGQPNRTAGDQRMPPSAAPMTSALPLLPPLAFTAAELAKKAAFAASTQRA